MPDDRPDHESENDIDAKEKNSKEQNPPELLSHPSYEELLQKLDESEQKTNQYWERILRMQADAENAARRVEREMANAHKFALEKFVFDLVPIIDSLELCIVNATQDKAHSKHAVASGMIEGVNLTLKMFYAAMEKVGVKQVNPLSLPFDPEFQQAISMQVDPTVKPGTVLSVLQKGYTLNNRLVRPALVVVAKAE